MKYNPSIAFDEMSGSAKGVTAAKTRGRKYIRNRGYSGSTRTNFQASVKAVFNPLESACVFRYNRKGRIGHLRKMSLKYADEMRS